MLRSDNLDQLATALAQAQASITGALKDSTNPYFKSKYADLASVWDAVRQPLTQNGLSVTQFPVNIEGNPGILTILMHASGQHLGFAIGLPLTKITAQETGSLLTYLSRYALRGVTGCPGVDDDAELVMGHTETKPHPEPTQPPEKKVYKSKPRENASVPLGPVCEVESDIPPSRNPWAWIIQTPGLKHSGMEITTIPIENIEKVVRTPHLFQKLQAEDAINLLAAYHHWISTNKNLDSLNTPLSEDSIPN